MELESLETGAIINTYETIIIFDPTKYKDQIEIFRDMCQEFTGKKYKIKEEQLGVKKLAYPIREKFTKGYYVIFTWQGIPSNVSELERCMHLNKNVLKFITVKKEDAELEENDAEYISKDVESEQSSTIDALDVMLGLAEYKRKEVV